MEIDDMVRVAKKCPYCGATNPEHRTRLRGYRCRKCKKISIHPKVEKIGRVL
jgi:tRNA(Ile2) C34 agmatinyltransferase TiaS